MALGRVPLADSTAFRLFPGLADFFVGRRVDRVAGFFGRIGSFFAPSIFGCVFFADELSDGGFDCGFDCGRSLPAF